MRPIATNFLAVLFFIFSISGTAFSQNKDEALDHYVKAENFRQKKQFKEALAEYENAVAKDAGNYKYHFDKGRCHIFLRDEDNALKCFEKTVQLKADYTQAHARIASIYSKKKMYDQAITAYNSAFKTETDVAAKLKYKMSIIKILDSKKRLAEAGNHINDALQIAPDDFNVLFFDGKYKNIIGKHEEAKQSLLKSTSKLTSDVPKDIAKYFYELGYAQTKAGNYEDAQESFKKAKWGPYPSKIVKLQPTYFHSMAISYFKVYELEESKSLVEEALKISSNFARGHDLLVKIAAASTDKSAVIEHQKSSIETERDPLNRANKFHDLSSLELDSRRYEDAIKSADECLKVQSKNYAVIFIKAVAQYKLNKTAEAIKSLEDLLEIPGIDQETKAQYHFALGIFYNKIDKHDQSVDALKKAAYGSFRYAAEKELEKITKTAEEEATEEETTEEETTEDK